MPFLKTERGERGRSLSAVGINWVGATCLSRRRQPGAIPTLGLHYRQAACCLQNPLFFKLLELQAARGQIQALFGGKKAADEEGPPKPRVPVWKKKSRGQRNSLKLWAVLHVEWADRVDHAQRASRWAVPGRSGSQKSDGHP